MRRPWLLLLCLALAGCGGRDDGITLSAVALNATDPFWITVGCGARDEAARLGVRLDWTAVPTLDIRAQAMSLEAALLQEPDGLILVPASARAFVSDVEHLMNKGTPVDLVSGTLASPVEHRWIGTDVSAQGPSRDLARLIARQTGGRGTYAVLAGRAGTGLDEPRRSGLEAALAQLAPNLRRLPVQYPETDRTRAATAVAGLLARYRDLRAIYATSGPEGIGAAQAVRESGRPVGVYAYDAMPEQMEALRRGDIDALLAQSPEQMGRQAVRSLVAYATSGRRGAVSREEDRTTPTMLLTRENLDTPAAASFPYRSTCRG